MGLKNLVSQLDLVGGQGPVSDMASQTPTQFNAGSTSTLQPDSLTNTYNSSIHNVAYGPAQLDINGQLGPAFNFGSNSTLQPDSLTNVYNSSVHSGVAYGPAQLDMDGVTPPQYLDNPPD
jgi:hypothetical protein